MELQTLPPINKDGVIKPEPEEVITRRMKKSRKLPVVELLIRWQGQLVEDATLEPRELKEAYIHLVVNVF